MSLSMLYGSYFSSISTVATILVPLLGMGLLSIFFIRTKNPHVRSWTLGLMLLSSIFLWIFVGLSLVLCYAFAEVYEYQLQEGIRAVFGRALIISIASGLPLSLLLREISPKLVLRKVKGLHAPRSDVAEGFGSIAAQMGLPSAQLQLSDSNIPISFAIQTSRPIIVMSERLLSLLKKDELEAVMAHELAHIRNSDTALKALVTAYKTVLPIDPVVRLVEAAFHREREMVADETAAIATKRPLSLASALLKIYEAFPKNTLQAYGTLSILGAGSTLMSRHPPIRQRISQLIRLAERYQ